jgi:hypothetical protein
MRYLLPKLTFLILGIGGIFFANWLLKVNGLNHGRWQSCTMFLPSVFLAIGGVILNQYGMKAVGTFIFSGLFFVFGIVVLVTG